MRATAYFVGNLTRDPELRQTGSGTAVANFDLAINSKVGDDEQTDYFRSLRGAKPPSSAKSIYARV